MDESEIEHYLALAHDDLIAAEDNLRLGHLRVAASRAYYSMFYMVTALLGSRGEWRNKHQGVIAAFGELFVKTGQIEPRYGRMLHNAFSIRLNSDYEPTANLSLELARQAVQDAADFVQRVERVLNEASK